MALSRLKMVRAPQAPRWVGPTAFLVISAIGIFGMLWGTLVADPPITIRYFDAGPVDSFAIRQVNAYPEVDMYIVGLDNGKIRALDARVEASGCVAEWRPDDARGRAANPGGLTGVFEDPCSGALWSMEGNAVEGAGEPLRTPAIDPRDGPDGKQHIWVQTINQPKVD